MSWARSLGERASPDIAARSAARQPDELPIAADRPLALYFSPSALSLAVSTGALSNQTGGGALGPAAPPRAALPAFVRRAS